MVCPEKRINPKDLVYLKYSFGGRLAIPSVKY
jgi:hypothetical protein